MELVHARKWWPRPAYLSSRVASDARVDHLMIGLRVSKPTITLLNATNKELIVFVSPNPNQLHLRKKKVVNKMEASAGQTGVANAMAGSTMEHEYEAPVAENKTLKYVMSPTGHKKKISVERDVYLTVVQYKPDEGKFLFIQEERFHRAPRTPPSPMSTSSPARCRSSPTEHLSTVATDYISQGALVARARAWPGGGDEVCQMPPDVVNSDRRVRSCRPRHSFSFEYKGNEEVERRGNDKRVSQPAAARAKAASAAIAKKGYNAQRDGTSN
eukprot:scaffold60731_cov85-Phaeocystis_antarctica.AAC.2